MKKRNIVISIVIILIAVVAGYLTFFYSTRCPDYECFNQALANCEKITYTLETEDAFWHYKIQGKSDSTCNVRVSLVQLKDGDVKLSGLEGKEMICSIPLGSTSLPQQNLRRCHGLLKEEMQELIINKLHNYITDHLGEISEELQKAL